MFFSFSLDYFVLVLFAVTASILALLLFLKTTIFVMAAMRSRCGHYIFVVWFLLSSSSFFLRLFSAVADWMSTILPHVVWP